MPGVKRETRWMAILETLIRLDTLEIRELHLAVHQRNPARRLYRRCGFQGDETSEAADR
jgi:hypothetical protein